MSVTSAVQGAASSSIDFSLDPHSGLSVTIKTANLTMRSVMEADLEHYLPLYSNPDVMTKFADGKVRTRDQVAARIKTLCERWQNNDPYSGFTVFTRNSGEFVGSVLLGHGDNSGEAELAGLGLPSFWSKGYGTEAATALVKEYAPATLAQKYTLKGKALETITTTARTDNLASVAISKKLGMGIIATVEKYGATRHLFSVKL